MLCKIVGFLRNKYDQRLNPANGKNDEVFEYKYTLSEEVIIIIQKWNRRKSAFQQLKSSQIPDFPRLSRKQFTMFFTGSYQLSQGVSYLAYYQHM